MASVRAAGIPMVVVSFSEETEIGRILNIVEMVR